MDAMERLKDSMVRVKALIDYNQEDPTTTIFGTVASSNEVTMEDLKILLDGLKDRDISTKRPDFVSQKEIERDITIAKETIGQQNYWVRGYNKGYKAGRDGELRRIEVLINKYLKGECK